MISTKQPHDAPFLTLVTGVVTIVAIPVIMYILFTIWPESLARHLAATACILFVVAFSLYRNKYETLLIAIIFLSQFTVSLHSFNLAPPVILNIFLSDLIILLLLIVVFERRQRLRIDSIGRLFIIWIGWLAIDCLFSAHLHRSIVFVTGQIKYFILYALALNITISETLIKKIEKAILALILMQTIIGVAQLLHGGGLGLDILGESFNKAKTTEYFTKGFLRPIGTIGATNAYAGYMAMLLVFLLPFVLTRKSLLFYSVFGIGVVGLIIPLSRAGWLSFIVGSMCVIFMMWRTRLLRLTRVVLFCLLGCLVAAGVTLFYADKIIDRFENRQAIGSAQGRIDQIYQALPLIEKFPVTGIGPGVSSFFSRWSNNRTYVRKTLADLDMPNNIHNGHLQILVESGIPGFILFFAIIGTITWNFFSRKNQRNEDTTYNLLRIGGVSCALSIMVHISFGTEFDSLHIFQVYWVLLGLALNRNFVGLKTQEGFVC